MQFRAEEYYRAGLERMEQAEKLYQDGNAYALAIYCGGLAVECLLRAFRWTEDATFEGRHDLEELLKASRLLKINEDFIRRRRESDDAVQNAELELRKALNKVTILWHNNLRFASESSLKAYLKRLGRLRGVKGDPLKTNARELIEAGRLVINRGAMLWISKRRS